MANRLPFLTNGTLLHEGFLDRSLDIAFVSLFSPHVRNIYHRLDSVFAMYIMASMISASLAQGEYGMSESGPEIFATACFLSVSGPSISCLVVDIGRVLEAAKLMFAEVSTDESLSSVCNLYRLKSHQINSVHSLYSRSNSVVSKLSGPMTH